jgi:outer membrane protein TolC
VEAASVQVNLAMANLTYAEQTLMAERALREAGRVIQKDLLESMATVDDALTQVEQARGDFQLALIELERLKGSL